MFDRQSIHVALLLWGFIFCLIAAVCMFVGKNFDREKRKWMLLMQLSTAILLCSDAFAWEFRGKPGIIGYYIVRISNFLVFAASDVILFFFHAYICMYLLGKEEQKKSRRVKIVGVLCLIGVLLVILSQFTQMYYYFDANNFYHRNAAYPFSMLIPVTGMLIDLSLLLQYRKRLGQDMFLAMLSYIVLPLAAAGIQIFYYGISFINIAIGISMILMFVVAIAEQNRDLGRLSKSKAEAVEKLEIATTLNKCVAELSTDKDIRVAIYNLLGIINNYFKGDRTYIFEIDYDREIIIDTHEYVRGGITEQIDNLQEVPLQVISVWMEKFKESQAYYIADLKQEQGTPAYDILREQEIERLLAVPLKKDGTIIGFVGVDNPTRHYSDATLLSSIQFFITNSLAAKKQQEQLQYLSYRDMLTGLYNRNKYIQVVESYEGSQVKNTGVAYIDLNGLKTVNDKQGHAAGDRLIKKAAEVISDVFPEHAYRVGGDEFVIVCPDKEEHAFYQNLDKLQDEMKENEVSISSGVLWKENVEDLESMLKHADQLMYQEKEAYHQKSGDGRR